MEDEKTTVITRIVHIQLGASAPAATLAAMNTILRIIQNILKNPHEDKYKRIPTNTKTWQTQISCVDGAIELLKQIGFERRVEDFQEWWKCNHPDIQLFQITEQIITNRLSFNQTRVVQANINATKAKQEEKDYQDRVKTQIRAAEREREDKFSKQRF